MTRSNKIIIRMSFAEHALLIQATKQSGISLAEHVRKSADTICRKKTQGLEEITYRNEKSTMVLLSDDDKRAYAPAASARGLSMESFLRHCAVHASLKMTGTGLADLLTQIGAPLKRKSPRKTPALIAAQKASGDRFARMRQAGAVPHRAAEQTGKIEKWLDKKCGCVVTTNEAATETGVSIHLVRDIFSRKKKKGDLIEAGRNKWIFSAINIDKSAV